MHRLAKHASMMFTPGHDKASLIVCQFPSSLIVSLLASSLRTSSIRSRASFVCLLHEWTSVLLDLLRNTCRPQQVRWLYILKLPGATATFSIYPPHPGLCRFSAYSNMHKIDMAPPSPQSQLYSSKLVMIASKTLYAMGITQAENRNTYAVRQFAAGR